MNITEPLATCSACAAPVADVRTTKRNPKAPTGFLHAAAATLMIAVQRNGAR